MGRADMSITVRNLTNTHYDWLDKEKKRTGHSLSTVIRILIQEKVDRKRVLSGKGK